MSFGPNPWQQRHWDWRAAGNFIGGGLGSGLIACAAFVEPRWPLLVGAVAVALGLASVWLEIGRPWRALHVYLNPRTSWMSREAIVAPLLLATAVAAWWFDAAAVRSGAALLALAYLYCQGRILQSARGIPAWREPLLVPLMMATGLAEGAGLWLLLSAPSHPATAVGWLCLIVALGARWALWSLWRSRIRAAPPALAALDRAGRVFLLCTALPLAAAAGVLATPLPADVAAWIQALCGVPAVLGGVWFKFALVTRAAFNQGFTLVHLPVRGVRHG